MKPVMLALSTFRYSENPIKLAVEKAKASGKLAMVYVVDVNLARYMVGSDIGLFSDLKERCEKEILEEHRKQAEGRVAKIAEEARRQGIDVVTHVRTGRFALVCLDVIDQENPECVVTTRSRRPKWVKKFFGSPVDYLASHAPCPVIES